jgi:DnaK suppressor protein
MIFSENRLPLFGIMLDDGGDSMRRFRVFVGSAAVCGCLFASGLFTGGTAAQSAEPVGGPLQLLKLMHPGKSEPSPRAKRVAKPVAKSADRSAEKSSTKTRLASRKKPRSYFAVAERKRHQVESALQAAAPPAPPPPASDNAFPPAPTAMTADAATLAPVQQQMPAAPQIIAPTAGTPSQLVVDGQTVQIASADEANEIDLAASDANAATAVSRGPKLASNTPLSAVTEAVATSEPTTAALAEAQKPEVSTTSWILQVLAALGGAVAAGTVAWLLMRSAPPQIEVSE